LFKPITLFISLVVFLSGYWFYSNITTPQSDSLVRVTNLPWQITVKDPQTLHVFDLDIGKATLGQAVLVLKSEYELAWFENSDNSISLEAYFLRVSLSGLRAKIVLELDPKDLDRDFLKQNSGKPEILASRSIKYPLDDLAHVLSNRTILSLTYVPKSSVEPELIESRFGHAEKVIKSDENISHWFYPQKGLVISLNKRGKEAFQYIPTNDFKRLEKSFVVVAEEPVN
jgi:hypothetical protein